VRGHYCGELGILFDALRTETTMSDKSETSKVPSHSDPFRLG
jgi:hypothetical protein